MINLVNIKFKHLKIGKITNKKACLLWQLVQVKQ